MNPQITQITQIFTDCLQRSVFILFLLLNSLSAFGAVDIRINEVATKASPDWAELYCVNDGTSGAGVDISGFLLTDLEFPDDSLADSSVTMRPGDYIVVHWGDGEDETDATGDTNGNGYIDLYLADTAPYSTDDQLVLVDGDGEYLDAICWANQDGKWSSPGEDDDISGLADKGEWIIGGTTPLESDCVDSDPVTSTKSLARDRNSTDTDRKEDWFLLSEPTPGARNPSPLPKGAIIRINEVSFKEESSRDWIEYYCVNDGSGGVGIDIGGCYIKAGPTILKTIKPGTIIRTGEYLVLHQGILPDEISSNRDGIIDIFAMDTALTSTDSQIVFYDQMDQIEDAVCWADRDETWSGTNAKRVKELSEAGQWQIAGSEALPEDCVDSTGVETGYSIAREKTSTDTDTKDDWYIDATPSMGRDNTEETPSTRISHLALSNRCFLTDGSDPGRRDTTIFFTLTVEADVTIRIYDVTGRRIRTLVDDEEFLYGKNSVSWDGLDDEGRTVPIGIYICYLEAINHTSGGIDTKKITIVAAKQL